MRDPEGGGRPEEAAQRSGRDWEQANPGEKQSPAASNSGAAGRKRREETGGNNGRTRKGAIGLEEEEEGKGDAEQQVGAEDRD